MYWFFMIFLISLCIFVYITYWNSKNGTNFLARCMAQTTLYYLLLNNSKSFSVGRIPNFSASLRPLTYVWIIRSVIFIFFLSGNDIGLYDNDNIVKTFFIPVLCFSLKKGTYLPINIFWSIDWTLILKFSRVEVRVTPG